MQKKTNQRARILRRVEYKYESLLISPNDKTKDGENSIRKMTGFP